MVDHGAVDGDGVAVVEAERGGTCDLGEDLGGDGAEPDELSGLAMWVAPAAPVSTPITAPAALLALPAESRPMAGRREEGEATATWSARSSQVWRGATSSTFGTAPWPPSWRPCNRSRKTSASSWPRVRASPSLRSIVAWERTKARAAATSATGRLEPHTVPVLSWSAANRTRRSCCAHWRRSSAPSGSRASTVARSVRRSCCRVSVGACSRVADSTAPASASDRKAVSEAISCARSRVSRPASSAARVPCRRSATWYANDSSRSATPGESVRAAPISAAANSSTWSFSAGAESGAHIGERATSAITAYIRPLDHEVRRSHACITTTRSWPFSRVVSMPARRAASVGPGAASASASRSTSRTSNTGTILLHPQRILQRRGALFRRASGEPCSTGSTTGHRELHRRGQTLRSSSGRGC